MISSFLMNHFLPPLAKERILSNFKKGKKQCELQKLEPPLLLRQIESNVIDDLLISLESDIENSSLILTQLKVTISEHLATTSSLDTSITAKAIEFVQTIISILETHTTPSKNNINDEKKICLISRDALVFQAEAMMKAQEHWRKELEQQRPVHVDIGFHYTKEENLESVKQNGLLNCLERKENNIRATNYNGATYGEGIYTGNKPTSHTSYGPVGLVVLRLKGIEGILRKQSNRNSDIDYNNNVMTYQANNNCIINHERDIVVLQHSYQCMAILYYPTKEYSKLINSSRKLNDILSIVDKFFNLSTTDYSHNQTRNCRISMSQRVKEELKKIMEVENEMMKKCIELTIRIINNHQEYHQVHHLYRVTAKVLQQIDVNENVIEGALNTLNLILTEPYTTEFIQRSQHERRGYLQQILQELELIAAKLENNTSCVIEIYTHRIIEEADTILSANEKKLLLINAVIDYCQIMNNMLCQCDIMNDENENYRLFSNCIMTHFSFTRIINDSHKELSKEILQCYQKIQERLFTRSKSNTMIGVWDCQRSILYLLRCVQQEELLLKHCSEAEALFLRNHKNETLSILINKLKKYSIVHISWEYHFEIDVNVSKKLLDKGLLQSLQKYDDCWIETAFLPMQELRNEQLWKYPILSYNSLFTQWEIYLRAEPDSSLSSSRSFFVEARWTTDVARKEGRKHWYHKLCNKYVMIKTGQWYHIILAYNHSGVVLYVNGQPTYMKWMGDQMKDQEHNIKSYFKRYYSNKTWTNRTFDRILAFPSVSQTPIEFSLIDDYAKKWSKCYLKYLQEDWTLENDNYL